MKRGSTIILRTAVYLMGLIVLVVCAATLPDFINGDVDEYSTILLGMYISTIPFCFALHQTLKLLNYIDKNKAFSELSVSALKNVKYCALLISGLYAVGLPLLFKVADRDDAPGVFALGLVIVGASFVIATSAAVLQKLLENVIDIKSENDLTV